MHSLALPPSLGPFIMMKECMTSYQQNLRQPKVQNFHVLPLTVYITHKISYYIFVDHN